MNNLFFVSLSASFCAWLGTSSLFFVSFSVSFILELLYATPQKPQLLKIHKGLKAEKI